MSNSLEAIRKEILTDARAEAEKQHQYAKKRATKLFEDKEKEAKKSLERRRKENSLEAHKVKERLMTGATLEMGKERLKAKRDSIDLAFAQALQLFEQMDRDEYLEWIEHLMTTYAETGTETVQVGIKDKTSIDESVIKRVNKKLDGLGRKGKLKLANEVGQFEKGFLLLADMAEINCSLEALIHQVRQELEPEVASVLFG